jgi:transglutaminase-like putative cysteine protease
VTHDRVRHCRTTATWVVACSTLVLLLIPPRQCPAARAARATYLLVSFQCDMRLDPNSLLWSGRTKSMQRFRIDGPQGLDLGTFEVEKSSILGIDKVRTRIRRPPEAWRDAECNMEERPAWSAYPGFDDIVYQVYRIRGLRIGDEVEIEIDQRHELAWEIPEHTFGDRDSIRQEFYEVRLPAAVVAATSVSPGMLGWPAPQATERRDGDRVILRWEAQNESGLGDLEPGTPGFRRLLPTVRVAAARVVRARADTVDVRRTWSNFASWYEERVDPLMQLDARQRAWVAAAKNRARSEDELVAAIFTHVQQQVRYLAVEVGEGSWIPHPAAATEQAGYGDCKDMSALLVALLRAAGLPAQLALVRSRGSGEIDTAFPFSLQFDHVVARVPGGKHGWWLDATADFLHAGEVAPFITRNLALVLAADSTRFELPRPRTDDDNEICARCWAGAVRDGQTPLRFVLDARGAIAPEWRHELNQGTEAERLSTVAAMLNRLFDQVTQVTIDSLALNGSQPWVRGHCIVRDPRRGGGTWMTRGVAKLPMMAGLDSRRMPLEIGPARRLRTEISMPAPGAAMPDSTAAVLDEAFASFRTRVVARGHAWLCSRTLDWKSEVVPQSDLPRLAAFVRGAQRLNDEIVPLAER